MSTLTIKYPHIKFKYYLLVFLLMAVSGNPAFTRMTSFIFLFVLIFELLFFKKDITSEGRSSAVKWSLLFIVIFIGQYLTLHKIGYLASINYIVKVLIAIFAANILKENFSLLYLRVIYYLSIIALFIWFLNNLGFHLPAIIHINSVINSLIVYTQQELFNFRSAFKILRNFGMFWEPGAFSGYILVAFFLFINRLDYLWKYYRRECIVLIVALLSTFSTTGYLIFSILVLFFLFDRVNNRVIMIAFALLFAIGFFQLFYTVEFLGEKIESEYEIAMAMDQTDINFSRIGAFIFDLQYIKLHPFFGNGLLNETRFSLHISFADNLSAFGNGFSGEIAYFGIPFMLIYFASVYKNVSLKHKLRLLVVLILVMQGEYFMNYSLFFIFPFVVYFNKQLFTSQSQTLSK